MEELWIGINVWSYSLGSKVEVTALPETEYDPVEVVDEEGNTHWLEMDDLVPNF